MIEAGTRMLRGIGHDLRTALTPLKLRVERMGESGQKDGLLSDIDRIESLLVENLNYPRNDYATETVELVDVAGILQTACSEFAVSVTSSDTPSQTGLLARSRPLSIARGHQFYDNAVEFAAVVPIMIRQAKGGVRSRGGHLRSF
ncbi:hypothetical protein HFO21_07440 [Rhizobium laguerreae]|uniref:hypothetical protein n=1 Tax=Rhizobium laguerreae TaxID=1076926 RepID=UPI001C91B3F2|nr:hypothetical protein [Rhizobium laguerreae]MBY3214218.1 hypothetical protein [Rhizobium laguerreae]